MPTIPSPQLAGIFFLHNIYFKGHFLELKIQYGDLCLESVLLRDFRLQRFQDPVHLALLRIGYLSFICSSKLHILTGHIQRGVAEQRLQLE